MYTCLKQSTNYDFFSFLPLQYLYLFFFSLCVTLTRTSRTMLSNGGAWAPPYLIFEGSWNASFVSSFSTNFAVSDIFSLFSRLISFMFANTAKKKVVQRNNVTEWRQIVSSVGPREVRIMAGQKSLWYVLHQVKDFF